MTVGLIGIAAFIEQNTTLSIEQFCEKFPYSFLLIERLVAADPQRAHKFDTVTGKPQRINTDDPGGGRTIFEIKSKKGGVIVSVGRAPNCDLVVDHPSVSKMHAFFHRDVLTGGYTITDFSSNGTTVNGANLKADAGVTLKNHDAIDFCGGMLAQYHSADSLYRLLQTMKHYV